MWRGPVALACVACIAATGAATAHHSIALFDREHPIELVGTVQDFKYISPHTVILLEVRANEFYGGDLGTRGRQSPQPDLGRVVEQDA